MYGCMSEGEDILCWMFLLGVMPPPAAVTAGSLTCKDDYYYLFGRADDKGRNNLSFVTLPLMITPFAVVVMLLLGLLSSPSGSGLDSA